MAQYTFTAPSNGYQFRITLNDSNVNPGGNNTSTVDWVIEHYQPSTNYNGNANRYLTINGTNVYAVNGTYNSTVYPFNSWWTVASGTSAAITHNTDGTKTVAIHFYWSAPSGGFGPGTVDQSWNFTLTTIPRYATFSSISASSITDVGFTANFTVDATCDQYSTSLDNGSTWSSPVTGDFTTKAVALGGNLASDTIISWKVKVRRKDSQLETTSSTQTTTTLPQSNFAVWGIL